MTTTAMRKRTPDEWCKIRGIKILDPDGWRGPNDPSWDTPIDWMEFSERASRSTTTHIHRLADSVEPNAETYWKEVQEMTAGAERPTNWVDVDDVKPTPTVDANHWTSWVDREPSILRRDRPHGCFPGPLTAAEPFGGDDMPNEDALMEAILEAASRPIGVPVNGMNEPQMEVGELMQVAEPKPKLLRWVDEQTQPGLVQYVNPAHVALVKLVTDEEGERRLALMLSNGRGALTTDEQTIDSFFDIWEVV